MTPNYNKLEIEYNTIKVPQNKIERIKNILKEKGIDSRNNAECVNTILDNFILDYDLILLIKQSILKSRGKGHD